MSIPASKSRGDRQRVEFVGDLDCAAFKEDALEAHLSALRLGRSGSGQLKLGSVEPKTAVLRLGFPRVVVVAGCGVRLSACRQCGATAGANAAAEDEMAAVALWTDPFLGRGSHTSSLGHHPVGGD